jgi:hypothetical protein
LKTLSAGAVGASTPLKLFAQPAANTATIRDSEHVASVKNLGSQFLDNQVRITGTDCASSIVLPTGDSLWLFGDTVEGPFKSIRNLDLTGLRSNTAAIVPPQDASQGIRNFRFLSDESKRPRQLVPFASDEDPLKNRIWAVHGLPLGQAIYVFYHRITLLKGVDVFLNFQLDGMGIAKAAVGDLIFSRLTAPDRSREFWKGKEPTFGVFVANADDQVYLWGCLDTQMFLARSKKQSLEDLSSHEYLVESPTRVDPKRGVRWSNKFERTAPLFDSVPNEMSAAYNPYLRKYLAIHSYHRENKIVMRTAGQLTGPWSVPELIYRPERVGEQDLIYAAKEHPELARDGGRKIYVTFVNSATYVPQLIEVLFK